MSKTNYQEVISDKDSLPPRTLPFNIAVEQNVLAALLVNNDTINRVGDYLLAEHFYEPVHQRIFQAIANFHEKGIIANPVTLKNYFDKDEALKDIGGAEYLVRLSGKGATSIINLENYSQIVYDLALKRNLITIGENIVNNAYKNDLDASAQQQIEIAEQSLFTLASEGVSETGFKPIKTSLAEAIRHADLAHKRTDKLSGVSTGFTDMDKILGGLQKSDLLIMAGRPSMGKTAISLNLAVNAAKNILKAHNNDANALPESVGFFSLEMSAEQLAARMIAMESAVDSSKMRLGKLSDSEFAKIVEGNRVLYQLPFFIDDTPALTISALRTRARRLKRKHNLGVLVVDYLQLLRGVNKHSESNRVQEVSEITQGLKAIAKELMVPVIALSQLSRAVEQREDKRPQLSDLRDSGSIEQDADIVMFIFREEYYELRREPQADTQKYAEWQARMDKCANITEIIIAKHRNGPVGTVKLYFNSNTTKFENFATSENLS